MGEPMQLDGSENRCQDLGADASSSGPNLALSLENRVKSLVDCLKEVAKVGRQPLSSDKGLAFAFSGKPDTFQEHELNVIVSGRLGRDGPRLVYPNENGDDPSTFSPKWTHGIMAKQKDKVAKGENGFSRCLVENRLVEWDQEEDKVLQTVHRVLLPYEEDTEKDEKMRADALARFETTVNILFDGKSTYNCLLFDDLLIFIGHAVINDTREAIEKKRLVSLRHPHETAVPGELA